MKHRLLPLAPLLLPLGVWLVLLPGFGRLQYHDYYDVIRHVTVGERVSRDLSDWLTVRSNEHWVPVPVAIYALNWPLTDGDNRALSALDLACLTGVLLLLLRLLPQEIRGSPRRLLAACAIGSLLTFAPTAAAQVVLGFAGTMWLTADLVAVGSLFALVAPPLRGRPSRVGLAVALGLLGYATYSTNLALWPALVGAALLLRLPWRQVATVATAGAAVLAAFLLTYETPGHHPDLETRHPAVLVLYVLRFLGSPVAANGTVATVAGLLLLVLAVVPALALRARPELLRRLVPWWALEVYVLGNAAMAAVARSGFGTDQAMSTRYLPLATLFLIALLAGIASVVAVTTHTLRGLTAVLIVGTVAGGAAFVRGAPQLRFLLSLAEHQPAAEFALRHGIIDEAIIHSFLPWPTTLPPVIPFLQTIGHVPFDRPPDPRIWQPLGAVPSGPPVAGGTLRVAVVNGEADRVEGWAAAAATAGRDILFVDASGVVRGRAFPGLALPSGAPDSPGMTGWLGWAARGFGPMRAVVVDPSGGPAVWLGEPIHVD